MINNCYMEMAINEAKKGIGATSPNPMVGAVIVKNHKVIGTGWHEKYGSPHAERNAIKSLTESAEGATLYVTLEPCCHYGKTPPCTEAIIENKISTVVIGSLDPNPLVCGKGAEALRSSGITVITGIMKPQCDDLNKIFFHYIKTKTPYLVMKYAMTADGKISTVTGLSKWITGEEARNNVHKSRSFFSAIMVGIGTVLADNPMLTCRIDGMKNPIRIICDTNLKTPLSCNLVETANVVKTIIATSCPNEPLYIPYMAHGCKIIFVPMKNGHLDLNILMHKLGLENIDSVLLEGGSLLNYSFLDAGLVKKIQVYVAPKIFGGSSAKTPIGGKGVSSPNDAFMLKNPQITTFGNDFLIEYEVANKCLQA